MNFLQNLPTLRVSSVPKTYQLYAHLHFPKPANFMCTSRLQHLSILRTSSVSNIQNPCPGFHSSDSLMLALLAKMRSSIYVGFREGPPTLVNIAGVNAYCKTPYLSYGKSANYPYHLLRMIYSFYIYAGTASFGGSHPNAFNFFKYAWIFRSALN